MGASCVHSRILALGSIGLTAWSGSCEMRRELHNVKLARVLSLCSLVCICSRRCSQSDPAMKGKGLGTRRMLGLSEYYVYK